MKTALHLMVAAGLLGLQVSVPAAMSCAAANGSIADCCCAPPQAVGEAPASCCSTQPAEKTPDPAEHSCTCSMGPSQALPPEAGSLCVLSSNSSLVHVIQVTPVHFSCLDSSFTRTLPGLACDAGPPGNLPPAYQLNCVYLR